MIFGRATFKIDPSTVDMKMPTDTVRNAAHFTEEGSFILITRARAGIGEDRK
jgi:hypothetical protein